MSGEREAALAHLRKRCGEEFSLDDVRDCATCFAIGPTEFLLAVVDLLNPFTDGESGHITVTGPTSFRIETRPSS